MVVFCFFFSPADPNVQVFTLNSSQSNPSEKPQQQKGLNPTSVQEYVCVSLRACVCVSLIPVCVTCHVRIIINEPPRNEPFMPPPTSAAPSIDATGTCGWEWGGIMGESPPLHPHILHAKEGEKKIPIHKHKLSAHIHNFQSLGPSRASTC